jgi:hypothetical protein
MRACVYIYASNKVVGLLHIILIGCKQTHTHRLICVSPRYITINVLS